MLRTVLGAILVAMVAATDANATDYRFSGASDEAVAVIDRDTIQMVPTGATRVMMAKIHKPLGARRNRGAALFIEMWEIDCTNYRFRSLFGKAYRSKGGYLGDVNPTDYQYIGKGTIADTAAGNVCNSEKGMLAPVLNAINIENLVEIALIRYGN